MNRYKKYLIEKNTFQDGDVVQWKYKRHLNSRSTVIITKTGKFVRKIRSVKKDVWNNYVYYSHCLVHFDGNKKPSRVPISEIEKI